MISFFSETPFELDASENVAEWIEAVIQSKAYSMGDISYVFCDDEYLLKINEQFLNHDTLTDIISFDYSLGKQLHGEIYISVERVKENANEFGERFINELHRVMIHGVLHYCGFKDKTSEEKTEMRREEDASLKLRTFLED